MSTDERYQSFIERLDFRLLEIATSGLSDLLLSVDEYRKWEETHNLRHVADVVVVSDAVAGAFAEAYRGLPSPKAWEAYVDLRFRLGLSNKHVEMETAA